MMPVMRTTLTLDDDVARLLNERMRTKHQSMKRIVNEALRKALTPQAIRREPYRLTPHHSGIRAGFDMAGFNKLADELEDEKILRVARETA